MFDGKKFNVLVRGQDTLFVVAQMDGKRKRDADKLRLQIANMLSVSSKAIVPNHDYSGLPEGKWFCFRYKKGQIPARIRRPSLEEDRHLFCAKELVLHFPEAEAEAPKPEGKEFKTLLPSDDDDEPRREGDTPTLPPTDTNALIMLLIQRQDEQMRQTQMLAELMGRLALKL